jgi:protein tyrosine phosphatase (PTP) superfamily phosphohydrolase (DUF442 family)
MGATLKPFFPGTPDVVRAFLAAGMAILAGESAAATWRDPPPNLVEISPRLVTSGQPSRAALEELKAQGFEAVVYLAPPTVPDAIKDEAFLVARQGLVFVNIPIVFSSPTPRDFEAFAGVMNALSSRRVLVHCQINLRASSMVFLYRAVAGKAAPAEAYESVSRVWEPEGPWKSYIRDILRSNNVGFDPF